MSPNRQIVLRLSLIIAAFIGPAFALPANKTAIVDVFIQTYVLNGKAVPSYTDERGNTHVSGKDYYLATKVKGTMGGDVKYRYFLEHVNLTSPEDSINKYNDAGPPVVQYTRSEQIDSASVPADIIHQLPATFTNPKHE